MESASRYSSFCLSMVFSENLYPLFGIMLWSAMIYGGRRLVL
jgi:hypothetical protein